MEKKKSKLKVIIIIIVAILVIVLGGGFLYVNSKLSKVQKIDVNKDNLSIDQNIEKDKAKSEIKNIALYGIDEPQGTRGRSDAVMILTIDNKHNKIKLTSIMRDSYVDVPGHCKTKLTHAYAYGGPELAIKTLNENFKLNIEDFMAVNFTSLPKIIDKIGGVNIDITKADLKYINNYIDSINHVSKTNSAHVTRTGMQNLNGTQSLAYSRIRYTAGGDYKRTERQRTVIEAIFNKMHNSPKSEYPTLINEFLPYVETNMSSLDMIGLAKDSMPLLKGKLELARFPLNGDCQGKMINGVWYLVFNEKKTLNEIQSYIYDNKPLPKHSNDN
ncbi:LCP family protein required for cell wall assembly [Clostridium moniliforme]|uniref:LCP family protein required for cell wall assembly n=1 Tax=Clostridium moniliforme TaxID=39489 RepID=A0ABS4EYT2_9CLOT|nr:LCP family protein [Clostridium moniliforme]MBP1889152.1 LCP family protein required for cell wall assembly [Clostridium moniliforme]